MAEHLDNLLKRIEDQAVTKAEAKARGKLSKAEQQAARIVAEAEAKAAAMIEGAKLQVALKEENGRKSLEQASRDFLLLVRKSVTDHLTGLTRQALAKTATADFLASTLSVLLPRVLEQNPSGVVVELSADNHAKLLDGLMSLLADDVKKGVELRPVKGVRTGFRLVLEGKNVHIDLADDSLVKMLCQLVNVDVAAALSATLAKPSN